MFCPLNTLIILNSTVIYSWTETEQNIIGMESIKEVISSLVELCRLGWYTDWSRQHKIASCNWGIWDSSWILSAPRISVLELAFGFLVVSGIPDSLSCIPDCNAQDCGFYKQKFLIVSATQPFLVSSRNVLRCVPDSLTWGGQKVMFSCSLVKLGESISLSFRKSTVQAVII